ncbi:MAG: PIG-L family deacetylase [Alphaproteobacteria bacterium]|nr:PIG-L family deacetylase [Alphaproteobacteria bacterium]
MTHDSAVELSTRTARAVVIVAHPDDETLWAGGVILARPHWNWFVLSMCRGSDTDRAPRFRRALERLGADGVLADLDDGSEQTPLAADTVQATMRRHLPWPIVDVILTHGPRGEYTRHRRHEETCRAAVQLWAAGAIDARSLWMFAYEDGGRSYLPRAVPDASRIEQLPDRLWQAK